MHSVKATLILSLTTLILLVSYIAYNSHQDRFVFLPIQSDKSIYVFDRKNNILNYCTAENQCKLVKLNLPTESASTQSVLPASLLQIIEGKQGVKTEKNTIKKTAGHENTMTVSATHARSSPINAQHTASVNAEAPAATTDAPPVLPPASPIPVLPNSPAQHAVSAP